MPVHAHLPRSVPAAGIIAPEPIIVVAVCGGADGRFQLADQRKRREELAAAVGGTLDALGGDVMEVREQSLEKERMFAVSAL